MVDLLRCPLTKSKLRLEDNWLIAEEGGLRYPVRDGIPVMLIEQAVVPQGTTLADLKARYGK
jgi:uncharacterized protein YbaR (Trm112 family)